jgi:hypothetical protein
LEAEKEELRQRKKTLEPQVLQKLDHLSEKQKENSWKSRPKYFSDDLDNMLMELANAVMNAVTSKSANSKLTQVFLTEIFSPMRLFRSELYTLLLRLCNCYCACGFAGRSQEHIFMALLQGIIRQLDKKRTYRSSCDTAATKNFVQLCCVT